MIGSFCGLIVDPLLELSLGLMLGLGSPGPTPLPGALMPGAGVCFLGSSVDFFSPSFVFFSASVGLAVSVFFSSSAAFAVQASVALVFPELPAPAAGSPTAAVGVPMDE